jgi:Glyoxalase-like domain
MRLSVVLDCLDPAALVEFWCTALGYQPAGEISSFVVLEPVEGEPSGPVFILQQVSEPRPGKNRMHVDIHPSLDGGVPALADRLEALGGRAIGDPVTELLDELGIWWVTMADPEGNELDLVADRGHPLP